MLPNTKGRHPFLKAMFFVPFFHRTRQPCTRRVGKARDGTPKQSLNIPHSHLSSLWSQKTDSQSAGHRSSCFTRFYSKKRRRSRRERCLEGLTRSRRRVLWARESKLMASAVRETKHELTPSGSLTSRRTYSITLNTAGLEPLTFPHSTTLSVSFPAHTPTVPRGEREPVKRWRAQVIMMYVRLLHLLLLPSPHRVFQAPVTKEDHVDTLNHNT